MTEAMALKPESPLKTLRLAQNKTVLVKLKDGHELIGKLELSDPTMNLVLSDCFEIDEKNSKPVARYGRVFIRGSQILFITIDYDVKGLGL